MSTIVDIHCHSSSKPFMSGIGQQAHTVFESYEFPIYHPIYNLLRKPIEQLSNIRLASQSNFDHLYEGGVRVAFVSMTPMEKAFTVLNPMVNGIKSDLIKTFLGERSNYRDGFVSSLAMNALTGYDVTDINYVKNEAYKIYVDLLKKEYQFLEALNNTKSPNGKYTVRFPCNYAELAENLKDDTILNILLTIEGAHAFGDARPLPEIQQGISDTHINDSHNVALANSLCDNIRDLRIHGSIPLFSVGLCHHFWNGLAGHARSLNSLMENIVNQDEGLNGPLLDNGRVVIDELSQTDYNGQMYKPVIVDIKHMSPQCRKDYYRYRLSKPLLKNTPFLCSHTGINMCFETLDLWIDYVSKNSMEKNGRPYDDDFYYLHEQSINLCREDLEELYKCRGLIGIQLDEKRIMGPLAMNELHSRTDVGGSNEQKYVYAKAIWANLFCAMDELERSGIKQDTSAWELFAIGSDFDGLINHLDSFESSAKMPDLKGAMTDFLSKPEEIILCNQGDNTEYTLSIADIEHLKHGFSNQELIEKIFGQNALAFLERNF